MKKQGMWVTLEGCDGAGHTAQRDRLVARLEAMGFEVFPTAQPSTGAIGRLIRDVLTGRCSERFGDAAMQLLYVADRMDHHARVVEPARERGAHVICDRGELSTAFYLAASFAGLGVEQALARAFAWHNGVAVPDLTVVLAVPARIAEARRRARGGSPERFEGTSFQARVAEFYEHALRTVRHGGAEARYFLDDDAAREGAPPRLVVVDGSGSLDVVEQLVWQACAPLFGGAS